MSEEKTILVKKKDGTFAKMKLSDLKKKESYVSDSALVTTKTDPVLQTKEEKVFLDKEDIKSPLEDEELKNIKHSSFNKRENEAEEIVKNLSFKVSDQAFTNLKNNLILFLKDIKNEEQISEILLQPVYLGGADLKKEQLKELLDLANQKIKSISEEKKEAIAPLKKLIPLENVLPVEKTDAFPASSSPFNSFVHKPPLRKEIREIKSLDDLLKKEEKTEDIILQLAKNKESKPSLGREDIVPPKNTAIGPVEEIKYFTVNDLRHLASVPEQAIARLQQKFTNLKEESFLLYLQAIEAWQKSPLYRDYLEQICESLNQEKSILNINRKEDNLTPEEISLIIKMEKEI